MRLSPVDSSGRLQEIASAYSWDTGPSPESRLESRGVRLPDAVGASRAPSARASASVAGGRPRGLVPPPFGASTYNAVNARQRPTSSSAASQASTVDGAWLSTGKSVTAGALPGQYAGLSASPSLPQLTGAQQAVASSAVVEALRREVLELRKRDAECEAELKRLEGLVEEARGREQKLRADHEVQLKQERQREAERARKERCVRAQEHNGRAPHDHTPALRLGARPERIHAVGCAACC